MANKNQQAALEQAAREYIQCLPFTGTLGEYDNAVRKLVTLLAAQRAAVLEEFIAFLAAVPCVCAHSNIHGSQEFDRHHESWCPKLKADRKLASLV